MSPAVDLEEKSMLTSEDGIEVPSEDLLKLENEAVMILTEAVLGENKKYSTNEDTEILADAVRKKMNALNIDPKQVVAAKKERENNIYMCNIYISDHFLKYHVCSELSKVWADKRKQRLANKLYQCDECNLKFHPVNNHPEACHAHDLDGEVDRIYKGHGREFGMSICELHCCRKKFLAYSPDCPEPAVEDAMGLCANGNRRHYCGEYERGLPPTNNRSQQWR